MLHLPSTRQLPSTQSHEGKTTASEVAAVKNTLEGILHYYKSTVGIGHTQALMPRVGFLDLAASVRPQVVLANEAAVHRAISPGNILGLSAFMKPQSLRKTPLLWDNSAIIALCESTLRVINDLESQLTDGNVINGDFNAPQEQRISLSPTLLRQRRPELDSVIDVSDDEDVNPGAPDQN